MIIKMNEVQENIAELQRKGWTLAAIADEVGVTWFTAQRWKDGRQYPNTPKPVLAALDALLKRKRIPKKRRIPRGNPRRKA